MERSGIPDAPQQEIVSNTAFIDGRLRRSLQTWFTAQGVPRLGPEYSLRERIPVLFVVLLVLLAFQVGIAPWLQLTTWDLLLIPPTLIVLTATALAIVRKMATEDQSFWATVRSVAVIWMLLLLAVATIVLLHTITPLPPFESAPWYEFGIVLAASGSAVLLWSAAWEELTPRLRLLVPLLLVVAIVSFAIEGSLVGRAGLGPALIVAVGFLILSLLLRLRKHGNLDELREADSVATILAIGTASLMFLFAAETAVLPHTAAPRALEGALPVAGLAVIGLFLRCGEIT